MGDETTEYIEREADLFQVGEYPDKGMTVTEADLDRLAASGDAPVKIEHSGGPITIGVASDFRRVGDWLKGKLRLLKPASELMDTLGIKGVSVAVPKDMTRILEVSWTGAPRVQGAQVYSGDADVVVFALGEPSSHKEVVMDDNDNGTISVPAPATMSHADVTAALAELRAKYAQLEQANADHARDAAESRHRLEQFRAEIRQREVEQRVDGAISAGQLPPVCKDAATAILHSDASVKFSDADTPVADLFADILAKLPRRFRRPLAGAGMTNAAENMTQAEKAFFAKHFPDLTLDQVAEFGLKVEV